jgi:ABC-2 type transport system permease protein
VLAPTWGINALRESAIAGNAWPEIGMCLLLAAVYLVIGHFLLRHFERLARERATLSLT